jgi:hypothetical protein
MRFPPAPALSLLIAVVVTASGVQAQPTDLTSYVLFAEKEFHANGLLVVGGNLGVNDGLLSSAGRPLVAATSTVAAESVRLESGSSCAALFSNDVQKAAPGCSPAQPLVPPILDLRAACGFPDPFPECDPSDGVLVLKGAARTLPPETYGEVRVKNGGVLTLSGGDYVFCSLHLSRKAQVLALAPTRIMIAGDLVVSNATRLVPQSAGTPCSLEIFATGNRAGIQRSADVQARLCAPNASLHVDHRARIVGTFAAATINAGRATAKVATALECPGQTTTTTTTTTTSTTAPDLCGNDQLDPGEDCDPPGGLTCPDSTGGAFVACEVGCTCPFGPATTTTTIPASTTSTSLQTTTTTTTVPAQCGNEQVEPGEDCDPPGELTCPDSTGGAFVACEVGCTCPFGPPTTTTTTLPAQCGNEDVEPGEDCDPPNSLTCPGSVSGAFLACNADCTCPPVSTTTTTPGPSTTTSTSVTSTTLSPGSTTTTMGTGSTTTTTLVTAELCGNCIDDDQNRLTDFEDPACCAETQRFAMTLTRGRIRPAGERSRLRIRSGLATSGLAADPLTQDVFLQIRPEGGTDILCARVPAEKFMRMHGAFKFWDMQHTVESAQGIDDMAIKVRRNGTVRFRTLGRRVRFPAPSAGDLQVTVAFYNAAVGNTANRCSTATEPFRTGRRSELLSP